MQCSDISILESDFDFGPHCSNASLLALARSKEALFNNLGRWWVFDIAFYCSCRASMLATHCWCLHDSAL